MAGKSFQLAYFPQTLPPPLPPSPMSHPRSLRPIGTPSTQDPPLHLLSLPMLLGSQWVWPYLRYEQQSTEQQVRQRAIEDCVLEMKTNLKQRRGKGKRWQPLAVKPNGSSVSSLPHNSKYLFHLRRGILKHCDIKNFTKHPPLPLLYQVYLFLSSDPTQAVTMTTHSCGGPSPDAPVTVLSMCSVRATPTNLSTHNFLHGDTYVCTCSKLAQA